MDGSGSQGANRAYYDAFSATYEERRGKNDPGGYHELLDELEAEFVRPFGSGQDVLEVGCGTGLLLDRIGAFAKSVRGVDISPEMLKGARGRGHRVDQASATELPFDDGTFDVTCSFKVLAHVRDAETALREMARVTRRGGYVVAEFYNSRSLRFVAKRIAPAGRVARGATERDVYTRFDTPGSALRLFPASLSLVRTRGIRIVTPAAIAMRFPVLRGAFRAAERALCDTPLSSFGGFWVAALEKTAA
jgi:ubiquinone/menaquinone biosynthesis C-methylase UbiE